MNINAFLGVLVVTSLGVVTTADARQKAIFECDFGAAAQVVIGEADGGTNWTEGSELVTATCSAFDAPVLGCFADIPGQGPRMLSVATGHSGAEPAGVAVLSLALPVRGQGLQTIEVTGTCAEAAG